MRAANVLFADEDLAVIDKPSGVSMFADRSGAPCLWDWLQQQFCGKVHQVHRLDKGTSGVLLVALSLRAQRRLTQQFAHQQIEKNYLAVCVGVPLPPAALVDLPLRKGRKSRYRVAGLREDIILENNSWRLCSKAEQQEGFASQTYYRTLRNSDERALLLVEPYTGRTHQIRVHLAWIGYPLVGDSLYGKPHSPVQKAPRLALHSHKISLIADWNPQNPPCSVTFRSPLPSSMEDLLR